MAKKLASYILIAIIILVTVVSLLAIWDIISVEDLLQKTFKSLFLVFVSAVVILFIFSVIIKDGNNGNTQKNIN